MNEYLVIVGINYGEPEKRVEPGTIVSDLPEGAIADLLLIRAIAPVAVGQEIREESVVEVETAA